MIDTPELHPKTLDLLREFEGKPRLKARLCEGGRYEVAYGVTYHLDDTPVGPNDTITEDQVMPYTLYALAKEAAPVWKALNVPVTAAQAGALAVLAFNVGGSAAAGSSVVKCLNEGRYEDAAASFGMWTGATSSGPSPTELAAGTAPKTGQVRQPDDTFKTFILYAKIGNTYRWVPPEYTLLTDKLFELGVQIEQQGKIIASEAVTEDEMRAREEAQVKVAALLAQQRDTQAALNRVKGCTYFRRFRGLLRRHHATGCLSLNLDWKEATKNDAISMTNELKWDAAKKRWSDQIRRQTEFVEVLEIARRYPLEAARIAQEPDPPKAAPTVPVTVEPLPEIKSAPPIPIPEPPLPKVEKPVSAPKPSPTLPNDFDPNAGVKSMVYSRRFWGWLRVILGRFSFATDAGAGLIAQTGGAVGQVANGIASDPLLLDAYTGFAVMITGEVVRWWGEKKATKVLK